MLRRHLNRKQVRLLIADQLKDTPSWAHKRITQVLGVDSETVQTVRCELETTSGISKFDKLIGADGKKRPVKQNRPPAVMATNLNAASSNAARLTEVCRCPCRCRCRRPQHRACWKPC